MLIKDIYIKKPIYGTKAYIRDKELYKAIDNHQKIRVIIPQGSEVWDPKEWIETGDRMEKVFRIPDKPMVLWGNILKLDINTPTKVSEKQGLLF